MLKLVDSADNKKMENLNYRLDVLSPIPNGESVKCLKRKQKINLQPLGNSLFITALHPSSKTLLPILKDLTPEAV